MLEGGRLVLREYGVTNGLREECAITITRCRFGGTAQAKDDDNHIFTRQFGTRWQGRGKDWVAVKEIVAPQMEKIAEV